MEKWQEMIEEEMKDKEDEAAAVMEVLKICKDEGKNIYLSFIFNKNN